jgi:hypothetical protein
VKILAGFSNSGRGVKLSVKILAGSMVLSAVGRALRMMAFSNSGRGVKLSVKILAGSMVLSAAGRALRMMA